MSKFSGLGARLHSGETSIDYIGKRRRWYAVSGQLEFMRWLVLPGRPPRLLDS